MIEFFAMKNDRILQYVEMIEFFNLERFVEKNGLTNRGLCIIISGQRIETDCCKAQRGCNGFDGDSEVR